MRRAEAPIGRWRTRFDGLIRQSKEGLFGDLQLGDACLLLAAPDQAIPLLRLVRRTAEDLGEERLWLSASVKLAQSFLATGRVREAWQLLNEDRCARVASRLPSGDPLQVDAWAIGGKVIPIVE